MTSEADRQVLLRIARDVLAAHLGGRFPPTPELTGAAARCAGAFVTLHNGGRLRGCVGHIEPTEPLGRVVARCAVAAATTDPRFPPVDAQELPHIVLELSILGTLEPVTSVETIEVGRHGLVIETAACRGLLLPQVATEWLWDRETFLAQTCRKAGLAHDAWKGSATIWRFEAEVFGEV